MAMPALETWQKDAPDMYEQTLIIVQAAKASWETGNHLSGLHLRINYKINQ